MSKTELLAPAKDIETAIAAIDCGADAVYIGGPSFGARSKAGNSLEDLKTLLDYAHKFYVKIYVTLNTILKDDELDAACVLIHDLYNIGVDGLIVQDMSIIKMAHDGEIPPIPLHASTQCDNRDIEKVKFFEEIGIPRVVLARELPLDKIREIKEDTNIELECFIHGALCVSYSGQCYLSNFIGGRSANRGECAQPCRKNYTLINDKGEILIKDKPLLSLKDFNATNHIKEMCNIGVSSFKIEGRLKDINYVKNAVLFYRRELDKYSKKTSSGKVFTAIEPNLDKTFNRGFTNYFLDGNRKKIHAKSKGEYVGKVNKIGKNYFVINSFTPAHQDGLLFENGESCLVNKVEGGFIYPNKMPNIKTGMKVYRTKDVSFEKVLNQNVKRQMGVSIMVQDGVITLVDEDSNRIQYDLPTGEKPNNPEKMRETFIKQFSKTGDSYFYVDSIDVGEISFMPVSCVNDIRRKCFELLLEERVRNYKRELQKPIEYKTYYKDRDDYHANVYNDMAKEFYSCCGCEITEYAPERGKTNNVELMRTKHCIKYALDMCKSQDKLYLIDDKGQRYQLGFDCKNCEMTVSSVN